MTGLSFSGDTDLINHRHDVPLDKNVCSKWRRCYTHKHICIYIYTHTHTYRKDRYLTRENADETKGNGYRPRLSSFQRPSRSGVILPRHISSLPRLEYQLRVKSCLYQSWAEPDAFFCIRIRTSSRDRGVNFHQVLEGDAIKIRYCLRSNWAVRLLFLRQRALWKLT